MAACSLLPLMNCTLILPHEHPVEDEQDDGTDERAEESGRLAAVIDADRPPAKRRDQRAGDADGSGDEKACGIASWHDELREQSHDETDHDRPDDIHRPSGG